MLLLFNNTIVTRSKETHAWMAVGVGQKKKTRPDPQGWWLGGWKMNEKRFLIAYVIQAARAFDDPVGSINHPGARLLIKKKNSSPVSQKENTRLVPRNGSPARRPRLRWEGERVQGVAL